MKVNFRHIIVLFSAAALSGFLWIDPPSDPGCSRQAVLEYTTDKSVEVTVYLVSSKDQIPMYYTTRLQSPVCMENLCNPIDIEIQWDLLGYFKDYVENPDDPVTKFDHQPFTDEDHKQLKGILANTESLLQDYRIEDLVDTTVQVYSEELDATTGATSKTFANDIVPGAIYTCYTLWTFVNGDLRGQLFRHTLSLLDDDLLVAMIESGQNNYLEFIFDRDSREFSHRVNSAIGRLIWQENALISVKAINAVGDSYWQSDAIPSMIETHFLEKENPVQNALIRHFVNTEANAATLRVFIGLLPELRDRQREQVYAIVSSGKQAMNSDLKEILIQIFQSPDYSLSAKEYKLLNELGIQLRE